MRKSYLLLTILTLMLGIGYMACKNTRAADKDAGKEMTNEDMVKRGEYLVNAIACEDCHSPKIVKPNGFEFIPELKLSGYPADRPILSPDANAEIVMKDGWLLFGPDLTTAVGPWGQTFAANLTSDPTGIGNWKEEQFIKAIREGKYKGLDNTRPILPPMPWEVYRNLSDDDLKAMFAYLKTTKPVKNVVPAPRPPKN